MRLSKSSCYFVRVRLKYYPHHPVLKYPEIIFFPGFSPIQNSS